MNKNTDAAIIIISAIYIMFTSLLDTRASIMVAMVAVICFVVYKMSFPLKEYKMPREKVTYVSKVKSQKKNKKNKKK